MRRSYPSLLRTVRTVPAYYTVLIGDADTKRAESSLPLLSMDKAPMGALRALGSRVTRSQITPEEGYLNGIGKRKGTPETGTWGGILK